MADIDDVMDKIDDAMDKIDEVKAMLEAFELINYIICTMCHGSGEVVPSHTLEDPPPGAIECPSCTGAGKVFSGSSSEKD